jgi:hypothetical protein
MQWLFGVLLLAAGCGGAGLQVADFSSLPLQSVTPDELVALVNQAASSRRGLRGKLGMGLQRGPGQEVKRCSGMLVSSNDPGRGLYLKGYRKLLPTFFTLVSDGREFWFHVPREDVVYTGPLQGTWDRADSLEFYLSAGDLFRALYVEPLGADVALEVEKADSLYAVTVRNRGAVIRRMWIERRRFGVVREIYYGGDGMEALEIQRDRYAELEDGLYPLVLILRDRIAGNSVFLEFKAITLNPDSIPEGAFDFEIPNGVDVRRARAVQSEA